jgi:hypothetical protein
MTEKKQTLSEKKEELEELRRSRSGATCTFQNSSMDAVAREMRIEELEEEISSLEKKMS